jgi:hypothetical protein
MALNDAGRVGHADFGCDTIGDAPPDAVQVEASHQPRLPGIQHPVLHRVPVRNLGGEPGRAEGDVDAPAAVDAAVELGADRAADDATCAVTPEDVISFHGL